MEDKKSNTKVSIETLRRQFPILEYDPYSKPIIDAKDLHAHKMHKSRAKRCLITYFQDIVEDYERNEQINQAFRIRTEGVRPRVYEMQVDNETIYIIPVAGGAPQAARTIENLHALGVTKFMVCGAAGTLNDNLTKNKVLVPTSAVRDEGTSYHYLPASREVEINASVLETIERVLAYEKTDYVTLKTWTTDASFRETAYKVELRKSEGCAVVEMECAAYFAVSKHLGVKCGQLLYAGDVVKKGGWEYRNWHTRTTTREQLFTLALKCLIAL